MIKNNPQAIELRQKLQNSEHPADKTYLEIMNILDSIQEKLLKIDTTLSDMKKEDKSWLHNQDSNNPDTQTPQSTGMSPGRCPIF